jgi:hypothetical protein
MGGAEASALSNDGLAGEDVASSQYVYEQALRMIQAQRQEQLEQDALACRLLESFMQHVVGLHACEVISGKNKLAFMFQGLDLVELLQSASGGGLLPGSVQEMHDKYFSKQRAFAV